MVHKRPSKNSATSRKIGKSSKTTKTNLAGSSKMTMCTVPVTAPHSPSRERRPDRRLGTGKRLAMARPFPGKMRAISRRNLDPCDNSNDSGLGFDNHMIDPHPHLVERLGWSSERAEAKRPRLDIKLEDDDANDNFTFPDSVQTCKDTMSIIRTAPTITTPSLSIHHTQSNGNSRSVPRCTPLSGRQSSSQPITLISQLTNISREGDVSLRIISQPEQQHRARYQTEGSRGAVKDRSGNGFPVVQLMGYNKPATLQVFIGTDIGKVAPHMFYQACRVSGKNSTPCVEKKLDGTVVIELQLDPTKDMVGTCDCVGILKERNVDVEHRFPDQIGSRSKKKSTRCRMVFRTSITHENGTQETLQVCSHPIVCTQPPGIPEICKKSLTSCPATGGLELFILGKNFLKDTKVFFQQIDEQGLRWEQYVIPDKEFLQQTHLVCVIPPYARSDITEPVTVRLLIVSSGKTSEPHQFVYTPTNGAVSSVHMESTQQPTAYLNKVVWPSVNKHEQSLMAPLPPSESSQMPPPETNQIPLSQRRSSINATATEIHSPPLHSLKQELLDENSQNSILDPLELHRERFRNISESSMDVQQGESISMLNENSIDLLRRNSVSLDGLNQNMENSMSSMSELIVRHSPVHNIQENSVTVPLLDMRPTTLTNISPRDELTVMDLRMKMPAVTVGDLASTNAPSMATLHSFGVTEPTNTPLPTQTAQSIENYLSTIETKSTNVDTLNLANNALQILTVPTSQKIIHAQVMPVQTLLDTSTTQSLSHLGAIQSHLNVNGSISNFGGATQSALASRGPVPSPNDQVLMQQTSLITESSVNPMRSVLDNGMTSNRIDNPDKNIHSPQDILIGNKLPLISNATAQDLLINNSSPSSLMVASTLPSTNVVSQEPSNVNIQTTSSLSPEIILNTQISPSLMCRNASSLTQEGLLSTICQNNVNVQPNLIQPPITITDTLSQQTTMNSLLTTEASKTLSPPVRQPMINNVINAAEPEKAILLKAAVDLLETQKKINELAHTNNTIEQVIMNNILSSSPHETTQSSMQQENLTNNLLVDPKSLVKQEFVVTTQIQSEKKNEDRMIPSGFATMSENELINIINPSCFDQV